MKTNKQLRLSGLFSLLTLAALPLGAQITNPSNPTNATGSASGFSKLLDPNDPAAKYANTIREKDLEAHLKFLASEELEGRETCERGQKIAAHYIASHFQRLDLKPPVTDKAGNKTFFQSFPMQKITLNSAMISWNGKTQFTLMKDFIGFDKGDFVKDLQLPLAYAGYGIEADAYNNYKDLSVSGKCVVVLDGEPVADNGTFLLSGKKDPSDWEDTGKKVEIAQAKGASCLLVVMKQADFNAWLNNPWMKHFLEGPAYKMVKENAKPEIPVIYISEEMAAELFKAGKTTFADETAAMNKNPKVKGMNLSKLQFTLDGDAKVEDVSGENVLGFLEGTDKKDEIVVLTAHYDHIGVRNGVVYNGADDDGTGTAAVLEMAEAFARAAAEGHRPRRSILFMPVSGEEKGLLGSGYYTDHPVFPLANTVVDLNIDMIGRIDEKHNEGESPNPFYVYVIGADKLSSELHTVNEEANKAYTKMELDYTFNSPDDPNRFYYRSDHYNFAKNNIPVIFYFSGVHEDYHQPGDDVEKIHLGKTMRTTKLVFLTAWEIANRDARLTVDKKNDFPSDR